MDLCKFSDYWLFIDTVNRLFELKAFEELKKEKLL